jgi:hypothetical protein
MTIREVMALVELYHACSDEAVRRRARALVPEIADFDEVTKPPVERWLLTAKMSIPCSDGAAPYEEVIGDRTVVCSEEALEVHKHDFGAGFSLANDVVVTAERIV